MKTVEMAGKGGPDVLRVGSRPVPAPGEGEVLIRVTAAGVNGPDLWQRRGLYPPPRGASDLLGLEVSGEIVALGPDVSGWSEGDLVCALTNGGGYAEFVAVPARHCAPIPGPVSVVDAAGLCETYFTVWSNLFHGWPVTPGELLLVHGGAGGIGSTAIQLARGLGLRVFATCADAADRAYVESLGAERVITIEDEDFVEVTRAAGGANLILDIIGGDYVARNIKAAASDARIVQLAFAAGSRVEIDLMPVMLKRIIYTGSTLRSRSDDYKGMVSTALREKIWPLFDAGRLAPQTWRVFPYAEAAEAHAMMERSAHRGKILLSFA
ncbi:NAD(P)H-quinone oxidoreductase [Amaricoccus solimangrovi]|uniref:NAD(P)H-quinone oxidoreductase n=2 Tax=Amaricoccus solimangrovi TaxID=2589815 RepID=A0A501WNY6_9RHOB|nr:NAD(P)H-quinone oxidoreductase [Amaricoccus solimangrovi]